MFLAHAFVWRGSRRRCDVLYANVRELPDESLRAQGDDWKVVVDWPFDDPGHTPVEDHAKVDGFLARNDATRTLVWLPAFFSIKTQAELGKLVILDHLLRGDNLDQYAEHLSLQDRLSARLILENQQSALAGTLRLALNAAYGIATEPQPGMLDAAHEAAEGHFRSLEPGFTPQVPVGADLKRGPRTPARPGAGAPVPRPPALRARGQEVGLREGARRGRRRPRGSRTAACAVDKPLRPVIKLVANPLGLGHMGEQYFVLEKSWQTHFNKQLAAEKASADGGEAAPVDGPAEAEGPGVVSRQPADPGLRRADQPRLLLRTAGRSRTRRSTTSATTGAAAAGAARRGRVGGGATPGEGGLRARRLRRGAAARPRTSRRSRARSRSWPSGIGEPATTWPARSGWRWPGWVSRTRRSPRRRVEDRPGGRGPGRPGWSARTRRPP